MAGPICMGRGRNSGNVAVTAHEYIGCLFRTGSSNKMASSSGAVGKSFSAVVYGRSHLCLVYTCVGNSCGAVLAKQVLLFHAVGYYGAYWGVIDADH